MAGSITGIDIYKGLVNGDLSAAQLDTLITGSNKLYLGAYRQLVQSGLFLALIKNSATFAKLFQSDDAFKWAMYRPEFRAAALADTDAINALALSSEPLALIFNNERLTALFFANATFKTAVETAVNDVDGYLYRDILTAASGNWTCPASGISAMYLLGSGIGGNGANASGSGGRGGSGGELKGVLVPVASLPAANSNTAYANPASVGTPTTFGALLSAASGANGSATGGGSTTNGGAAAGLSNNTVDSAAWHKLTFSNIGGAGGAGGNGAGVSGSAGTAGATGSGGAGATGPTVSAGQGTGLGSAGGGGYDTGNPLSFANGSAATDPGCGGGGGNSSSSGNGTGGPGGPAKQWVYTVRKRV